MDEGNTVCFLLAGDFYRPERARGRYSVTKIDLDADRICLFLGYRGETIGLQYNKVEEPVFINLSLTWADRCTARLEAETRHAPRMIIRVDYKAKLCEVTCGKVTLECDI